MYECLACMCLSIHTPRSPQNSKESIRPPKLELWMVVSHDVGAGTPALLTTETSLHLIKIVFCVCMHTHTYHSEHRRSEYNLRELVLFTM